MENILLIPGQHIHIVGISGFGMSAIARVLMENGYVVSGSDQKLNALSLALRENGVTIHEGHAEENIEGAELVLISSAIPKDNPELQAAQRQQIQVVHRRDFMRAITEGQRTIAIAGTHGKTTTTAMLAYVLVEAGFDPSYIVGGVVKNLGTNAGAGPGEFFVIEADEYDLMFLGLNPSIAVVNNVEYDHPDFFHTPQEMLAAFQSFVALLGPEGVLVACADDGVAAELAAERRKQLLPVLTYGVENKNADWWAVDLKPNDRNGTDFVVCHAEIGGGVIGPISLQLIGTHNVRNAMAAITAARHIGVPFEAIADALAKFKGTERRSEVMGEVGGVKIVNDYAHHPTAIMLTLKAWRERIGQGTLWAVWQPHTYSRTRALADSFKDSFGSAHHALVTDVFAAREAFTAGPDSKDLAAMITETGHPDARYSGDLFETAQILATEVQPGDIVVLLTAGDAPRIGQALLDVLNKRTRQRV